MTHKTSSQNAPWEPGRILLNEYLIEGILGQGAMGTVFLVIRKTGGVRFAVKTLIAPSMADDEQKRVLQRELRTWVDLPNHPNLTACRFFRTIEGRLAIFADYVNGGSVLKWLEDVKKPVLSSILDIAIQSAWGLQAAHDCGVVHQDVKPANLLMTKDGIVKVTDFGLSRARTAGLEHESSEQGTDFHVLSTGGLTPAYCSPEQALNDKLGPRTDIWSWGLSVLEMFTGTVTWMLGTFADSILNDYFEKPMDPARPSIPASVFDVLTNCFRKDPSDRWERIGDAAEALIQIYESETDTAYPRDTPPKLCCDGSSEVSHDRMTVHGKKWDDPVEWLEKALIAADRDPSEIPDLIPVREGSRRAQALVDLEIYDIAESIFGEVKTKDDPPVMDDLVRLFHQKLLVQDHLDDRPGAVATCERAIALLEKPDEEETDTASLSELASIYRNKGMVLQHMGNNRDAEKCYIRAIEIQEAVESDYRTATGRESLAIIYMNLAILQRRINDNTQALSFFDKAISILEDLVHATGRADLESTLAQVYLNKANALCHLHKFSDAVVLFKNTIDIRERLVFEEGQIDLEHKLALVYMNIANAVRELGNLDNALAFMSKCIVILERLVFEDGRTELALHLSLVYMNQARSLAEMGDIPASLSISGKGTAILEKLVLDEGRSELKLELAVAYIIKAWACTENGENSEAILLTDKSIEYINFIDQSTDKRNLMNDLAEAYNVKAKATGNLGEYEASQALFDQSISIREIAIEDHGITELAGDVALTRLEKAFVMFQSGDEGGAKTLIDSALPRLEKEVENTGRVDLARGMKILKQKFKKISLL